MVIGTRAQFAGHSGRSFPSSSSGVVGGSPGGFPIASWRSDSPTRVVFLLASANPMDSVIPNEASRPGVLYPLSQHPKRDSRTSAATPEVCCEVLW